MPEASARRSALVKAAGLITTCHTGGSSIAGSGAITPEELDEPRPEPDAVGQLEASERPPVAPLPMDRARLRCVRLSELLPDRGETASEKLLAGSPTSTARALTTEAR